VKLDAGAHRRLVIQDATAIPRRNVEVILPNGNSSYRTTNSRAFSIVQQGDGFWVNEAHMGVQLYLKPELVKPRGMNNSHFYDVWDIFPSDGIPMWQVRRGALAGVA